MNVDLDEGRRRGASCETQQRAAGQRVQRVLRERELHQRPVRLRGADDALDRLEGVDAVVRDVEVSDPGGVF